MENESEPGHSVGGGALVAVMVAGVWRYRLLVLSAVAVGLVVGLFRVLTTPNQYRSIGKLFVLPGLRESITPEAAFSGEIAGAARLGSREAIQNELQVLSSPQLYDKVVARLGADLVLAPYDPARSAHDSGAWYARIFENFQSWWFAVADNAETGGQADRVRAASQLLESSVSIYPEQGASVLSCVYVSHSPELAQTVVNAVLEAAKQMHRDVFDTMSSLGTIAEELRGAEEIARAAETVLRDFRLEKGIYNYDSQRDAMVSYLDDLGRQIDVLDVDMARRQAERLVHEKLLQDTPQERTVQGSESSMLNPAYAALTSFLLQLRLMDLNLEADRKNILDGEFTKRKGALESVIKETQNRLQNEGVQMKLEGARVENPNYVRLKQHYDDLGAEVDGLAAKKVRLETVRTSNRTSLASFEALTPQLRTLELDARQKRAIADRLAEGVASLRTVQRLEQLNLSNVQVMHGGTYEGDKISPRRSQLVLFGVLAGGALGVAVALLLAFCDRRVRIREDLARLGFEGEVILSSERSSPEVPGQFDLLPPPIAEARADISRFWSSLPYDRRATEVLKIGFVPCGMGADAARAAATLAIGLAVHGGERVVYVSCGDGPNWLVERLGLAAQPGWTELLRGEVTLDQAVVVTQVAGLAYLPPGATTDVVPHPLAGPAFVALLDTLAAKYRFVIVELPDLDQRPEGRSVLAVLDAAQLVVRAGASEKDCVRETVAAVRAAGARLLGGVLQAAEAVPS